MWNETWVGQAEEDPTWYYALLAVTVGAYAGSATLAGEAQSYSSQGCSQRWSHRHALDAMWDLSLMFGDD
jgi:hypothetical protein